MEMSERLPVMSDQELKSLLVNARRLETGGTPKQQADATALTPLIEAEIKGRKPTPAPKAPPKPRANAAPKPKAAAKTKAAKPADLDEQDSAE